MALLKCTFVFGILFLARPVWCQAHREQVATEKAKQQLVALENHWLQEERNPRALESILAPDFLHVLPYGIITKDEQIKYMRKHRTRAQETNKHFENLRVRVYGKVGIVNGIVVASTGGVVRKTLFTDVFVRRNGMWRAVNAQELPAARTGR